MPQIGFSTGSAVDERIEERTVPTDDARARDAVNRAAPAYNPDEVTR